MTKRTTIYCSSIKSKSEISRDTKNYIYRCFFASLFLFVLALNIFAQDAEQPYSLVDLNRMMRQRIGRDMTEDDLMRKVDKVGISFDPSPEAISKLRALGAHQSLINAIKRSAEKGWNASAMGAKVIDTAPPSNDQFIKETGISVRDYLDELPDFICNQVVERYYDLEGRDAWDRGDVLTYELTYNGKRESYKPINAVGKPLTKEIFEAGGSTSTGEWATKLKELFNPETRAIFKPAGKEKLGKRDTVLYDFKVDKANSKSTVSIGEASQIFGYSGTVWIESETKKVLKISLAIDGFAKDYPVSSIDQSIDYDYVTLKGLDMEFLVPVKSEVVFHSRDKKVNTRNLTYYKFYRKFESDIKIIDQ